MKKNSRIKVLLLLLLLLAAGNFYLWKFVLSLDSNLKVVFFDVGQGDSIFVETPQKHQILIDGGPSGDRMLEKLSGELPFWDRSIDLVILTHPDYDHLRGLLDVLDRYKVENILWTGVLRETKTFEKWLQKVKEEEANIVVAKAGQRVKAGNANFYILYPLENIEGELWERDSNDSSVVAKLLFGKNTFLLTGDITKKTEKQILEKGIDVSAAVLKVGHHGSKSSSQREFLEEVSPEIAVISCGKNNKYGHPHPEVLNLFQEFGINVLRTDEKGDIKIKANYAGYSISNF